MRKYRETYAVAVDGRLITCTNGHVSADADLVALVKYNVAVKTPVRLVQPFGPEFTSTLDPNDRLGTLAALMSPAPGRAQVLEAPHQVWEHIESETGSMEHYTSDIEGAI